MKQIAATSEHMLSRFDHLHEVDLLHWQHHWHELVIDPDIIHADCSLFVFKGQKKAPGRCDFSNFQLIAFQCCLFPGILPN